MLFPSTPSSQAGDHPGSQRCCASGTHLARLRVHPRVVVPTRAAVCAGGQRKVTTVCLSPAILVWHSIGPFLLRGALVGAGEHYARITPWVKRFVFRQQYGNVETLGGGDVAVQNSVEGLNMDCLFSQFVNGGRRRSTTAWRILTVLDEKIRQAAERATFSSMLRSKCVVPTPHYSEKPYEDAEGKPSLYPFAGMVEGAGPV